MSTQNQSPVGKKKKPALSLQAELLRAYMKRKNKILPIYDAFSGQMIYVMPHKKAESDKKMMSIAELAQQLGTNISSVQKWRKGERPIPPDFLCKIVDILDIPPEHVSLMERIEPAVETEEVRQRLIDILNSLDTFALYILSKNYQAYIEIGPVAWEFMCVFFQLTFEQQLVIQKKLYKQQIYIETLFPPSESIHACFKLREIAAEEYKKEYEKREEAEGSPDEYGISPLRKKLLKNLKSKVRAKEQSLNNLELLLSEIEHEIYKMERSEWDVLIAFKLLGRTIYAPTTQQQEIINAMYSLHS